MEHSKNPLETQTVPPRWHFMAGVLVVLAGAVAFGISLWVELASYRPNIRLVVPGSHEIELDESGTWTVYYEYESVVKDLVFSSNRTLAGLLVGISRVGDAEPLELPQVLERESYEKGEFAGGSILTFEAPQPGMYRVTGAYPGNFQTGDSIVLAIGRPGLLRPVLSVVIFLLAGLLIGGFVIVCTFVRRGALRVPSHAPAAAE